MKRRTFLATWISALTLFKARTLGYGYVDVTRSVVLRHRGIYLRAFLDGEDVTARCFEADDQLGYVGLFKHRDGRAYLERCPDGTVGVAREVRHGLVRFVEWTEAQWKAAHA